MYAFRCSDAGEGEDLEEWSLPTLLTFELAWSPEMVRRGHEKSPHCKILSPPRQPVLGGVASVWYMYVRQPGQRADSTKDILRMKKQNREIKTSPDLTPFPRRGSDDCCGPRFP